MILVVISAIIVATYIGLQLAIRAPEIQQPEPVSPPASGSQTGQPAAPPEEDPNALVRKEGVYTFALLGKDVKGSNTDTIILARYDTTAQTVGMVLSPVTPQYTAPGPNTPRSTPPSMDLVLKP